MTGTQQLWNLFKFSGSPSGLSPKYSAPQNPPYSFLSCIIFPVCPTSKPLFFFMDSSTFFKVTDCMTSYTLPLVYPFSISTIFPSFNMPKPTENSSFIPCLMLQNSLTRAFGFLSLRLSLYTFLIFYLFLSLIFFLFSFFF